MTTPNPFHESEEAAKARRVRSIVMAIALAVFVILVFVVTITRLGGHVADTAHL
jgi:hypothetical protein